MKYRIRTDLIFKEMSDAEYVIKFFREGVLPKVLNLAEEKSFVELEECYHDESSLQPCRIVERLEKE